MTAFLASFCVMVIELLAFRLVARFLGTSHYTATAIIGFILGGLTAGNYIGGLLADRYDSRKTLSLLFLLASIWGVFIPVLNEFLGDFSALWYVTWITRIVWHVGVTFTVPALLLGAVGPVVAKEAVDRAPNVGRAVGNIYALGAVGSIAGTFASGFFLVEAIGPFVTGHLVALALAIIAISYHKTNIVAWIWSVVTALIVVTVLGIVPSARSFAADVGLCDEINDSILFHEDSPYAHVAVIEDLERDLLIMKLDKLTHSMFDPADPEFLHYDYEKIFAALTETLRHGKDDPRILILGGGGYTHPRHILREYPKASIEVAEIDPIVTKAAIEAFGFKTDERINVSHLDARQRVSELARDGVEKFDIAFLDAVNDYAIPYHLTTVEFQRKIESLLNPDGAYLAIIIDAYAEGEFLAAWIKTVGQVFKHVDLFAAPNDNDDLRLDWRTTYVVAAYNGDYNLSNLKDGPFVDEVKKWQLSQEKITALLDRVKPRLLTDDYAPVEQLLANVVAAQQSSDHIKQQFYVRGNRYLREGNLPAAISDYKEAIAIDPELYLAWLNLGVAYVDSRKPKEAEEAWKKAASIKPKEPQPHCNIARLYYGRGKSIAQDDPVEAKRLYQLGVDNIQISLERDQKHAASWDLLGLLYAQMAQYNDAITAWENAKKYGTGKKVDLGQIDQNIRVAKELAEQ